MEEFYCVWIEDGGKPNQAYLTLQGAVERAEMLARDTGHRVFILKSILVVDATVPEVEVSYNMRPVGVVDGSV